MMEEMVEILANLPIKKVKKSHSDKTPHLGVEVIRPLQLLAWLVRNKLLLLQMVHSYIDTITKLTTTIPDCSLSGKTSKEFFIALLQFYPIAL